MIRGTGIQYGGKQADQDILDRENRKKRIQKVLTKYGVGNVGPGTGEATPAKLSTGYKRGTGFAAEKPSPEKLRRGNAGLPEKGVIPAAPAVSASLPAPTGKSEEEVLRSEVRQQTQLAKGVSPEELNVQAERREQKLQNISAQELGKRHGQAVGHLEEAEKEATLARYAGLDPAAVTEGLPTVRDPLPEDREVAKWRGIVNDLATQYYYRENLEKAAALAGDREARAGFQSIEEIREDMGKLGAISAGDYYSEQGQADLAEMMEKYGMEERELRQKAPELIQQLQGQWNEQERALADAGYEYGRMEEFDRRLQDARRAAKREESLTEFSQEHPVLSSAATVGLAPFQGAEYAGALLSGLGRSDAGDIGSYTPLNTYNMNLTRGVSAMRGAVARKAEEKWGPAGSFAYGVGMSMADFLTQAGATGAGNLTLGIMGSSAAANTTMECVDRGLTNRQALTLGAIAGLAEIVTEKVSLDALLDRTSLDRSAMGYFLKNVLAEGSEEVASDLINWVADVMVSREKSQWRQAIRGYENQGYSEGEAFGLALKDQAIEMGMSFLGGAISGGVMAGGSVAVNGYLDQTSAEELTLADDATADDIIRDRSAVNFLTRRGGLELNSDMTQEEKRQAVKDAVERVARHSEGGNETLFSTLNPGGTAEQMKPQGEESGSGSVFKPGEEEKQQGSKPTEQGQVFKPAKNYLGSDGRLDQERVKQDYRKFLQGVPEKNRMYLEQTLGVAEFEICEEPEVIFSYDKGKDRFVYNPQNSALGYYDITVLFTHDLAHRIDRFFVRAAENARFAEAIQEAGKVVDANPELFIQFCKENDREGFCSDILSAICKDKYRFPMRHEAGYWNEKAQAGEIFANLFSMETYQDKEKVEFLRKHFPELIASFETLDFYIH